MSITSEFKDFISKGNVLDLAVGVIIGAAFGKIVDSMVSDILMPVIGLFNHGRNFKDSFLALDGGVYTTLEQAQKVGAATLNYGQFLNAVINFLIIAFVIFMVVKAANRFKKPTPVVVEAAPVPTREELLLTDIRDSLRAAMPLSVN